MSRRILLHVGTPKTGTSYLQDVLFHNRNRLAEHGILYPAERFDAHFLAALDLMRLPWGGLESEERGAWDALAKRARSWPGSTIISHEILANASRAQTRRALESLGHPDTEIHLVLSVRDLVRQIPAEWQENVKHRRELSYGAFLDQLRDPARKSTIASWFWGVQEIPDIVDRWSWDLPVDRVHLVTVPPPDQPQDVLWQRFVEAFGLTGIDLDLRSDHRSNPSMGVPETALVRRINMRANRVIEPPLYRPLVRELLAHEKLAPRRADSPRLRLRPDMHPWARDLADTWIEAAHTRGYDVVGDLEDLRGVGDTAPDPAGFDDPDQPDLADVVDAGVDAIMALVQECGRQLGEQDRLRAELAEVHDALKRSYLRPSFRVRTRLVRHLKRSTLGRRMLRLYRAARGRSSRSA